MLNSQPYINAVAEMHEKYIVDFGHLVHYDHSTLIDKRSMAKQAVDGQRNWRFFLITVCAAAAFVIRSCDSCGSDIF